MDDPDGGAAPAISAEAPSAWEEPLSASQSEEREDSTVISAMQQEQAGPHCRSPQCLRLGSPRCSLGLRE